MKQDGLYHEIYTAPEELVPAPHYLTARMESMLAIFRIMMRLDVLRSTISAMKGTLTPQSAFFAKFEQIDQELLLIHKLLEKV